MKRFFPVIYAFMIFLLLSACQSKWQADVTPMPVTETPGTTPAVTPEPTVVPDDGSGPNVIGLYVKDKNAGVRRLVQGSYRCPWQEQQDIACFEAFASQERTISLGWYRAVWDPYWRAFSESAAYKVGYALELTYVSGEVQTQMILGPKDTGAFWPFVEIYLYDDVNQPEGQWYSHLTEEDMQDETLCSSIKLTPGADIEKVATMNLTVFTYRSQAEFHKDDGSYLGFNRYSIDIDRS